MSRTSFVVRNGQIVEKYGPDDDADYSRAPGPFLQLDLQPYASPVTGKVVDGRRARRYDLESTNCVPAAGSDRPTHRGAFAKDWRD
jgi:hypothetical protein